LRSDNRRIYQYDVLRKRGTAVPALPRRAYLVPRHYRAFFD